MFISFLFAAIFFNLKKAIYFLCIFHVIHFSKAPCVCLSIHQHCAGVEQKVQRPECWGLTMLGGVCCSSPLPFHLDAFLGDGEEDGVLVEGFGYYPLLSLIRHTEICCILHIAACHVNWRFVTGVFNE